jgi:hypothetical protein
VCVCVCVCVCVRACVRASLLPLSRSLASTEWFTEIALRRQAEQRIPGAQETHSGRSGDSQNKAFRLRLV